MTKQEFVDRVAEKRRLFEARRGQGGRRISRHRHDTLKGGGQVAFTGFGKFSAQRRAERQGVNPRTRPRK